MEATSLAARRRRDWHGCGPAIVSCGSGPPRPIVTRRSGREKLHFFNPVPIRLIHDRWIDKYTERHASALANPKADLETRK